MKVEHLDCRAVIDLNLVTNLFNPTKNRMKLAKIAAQPNMYIDIDPGNSRNNDIPVKRAITAVRAYARNVLSFA